MPVRARVRHLLLHLFRRSRVERDLEDEIRSTLDMLVEQHVAAGFPHDEALRRARIELGGPGRVQQAVRDVRSGAAIEAALRELRFAARTLRENPGLTAIAVLTLTLGIGANTAIFTLVNGVLVQPLPYPDSDRLVVLSSANETRGWSGMPLPIGAYDAFVAGCSSFDPAAFAAGALLMSGAALVACLVPARRACRIDAVTALRRE